MTTLASVCKYPVRLVTPQATIREAAEKMREYHVGALVVVASTSAPARPLGIVTDRDMVVAILALGLDPNVFLVDDLMGRPLVVAKASQRLRDGLELMKAKGVRRLPLVDKAGSVIGIVTLDDLVREVARDVSSLSAIVDQEISAELVLRQSRNHERKKSRMLEKVVA